ncbi:MAG: tRNA dihydrouridine synthase DusB [Bacteroidales bacterium]|nr:tRNA dihydrouridine synthase DusB [Bacteroidales bacterium]
MNIGPLILPEHPLLLAPMEDITDQAFRIICKKAGADVVVSEFAASDALIRNVDMTINKLTFSECERPYGIQIFGNNEDVMVQAAKIATALKPDFIDINWGCPVKKIALKGAGSGMLQNPELLVKITAAVVKATPIPVTVKTRLGWDEQHKIIVTLAEKLQDTGIAALTIHGRTKAQMYNGNADWTLIGEIKNNARIHIPVIGNGDISSATQAAGALQTYHVDGIMIGRAAIGNPWIFAESKAFITRKQTLAPPSLAERIAVCRQHLHTALQYKSEHYALISMRKHYKNYFKCLPSFKAIRMQLLTADKIEEIENLLAIIEEKYC